MVRRKIPSLLESNEGLSDEWRNYTDCALATKRIRQRLCNDEILERVNAVSAELDPETLGETQVQLEDGFVLREEGQFFNSTAYFAGDEEYMYSYEPTPVEKPIVYIACNMGALANVELEQFVNRGASLIATVKNLEAQNVSVGVIAYTDASDDEFAQVLQTIMVKSPEHALDESSLVNFFADCGVFRNLLFVTRHFLSNNEWTGATREVTHEDFKYSQADGHELVLLPYSKHSMRIYFDTQKSVDWTLDQVKEQVSNV